MHSSIINPNELTTFNHKHIVVVLDVFRASNTILALLGAGAAKVYLLAESEAAFALKRQLPQALLLGERQGLPLPGMDGGNSPALARQMQLKGKEVILTTSAGTQAIARLAGARAVVYGSFANAACLTKWLRQKRQPVSFLAMGLEAREPALEDDLAAAYLQQRLHNNDCPGFADIQAKLMNCPGAQRLRRLGQEDDLNLCVELDALPIIAEVDYSQTTPFARGLRETFPLPGARDDNPS